MARTKTSTMHINRKWQGDHRSSSIVGCFGVGFQLISHLPETQFNSIIFIAINTDDIENTRLVFIIAQVYPARLRKSEIKNHSILFILPFQWLQQMFYIFIFKTDYFP